MLIISTRLFCFWEKDGRVLVSLLNLNMSLKLDIHVLTSLKRCRSIVDTHFSKSQIKYGHPLLEQPAELWVSKFQLKRDQQWTHTFKFPDEMWVSSFKFSVAVHIKQFFPELSCHSHGCLVLITTVAATLSTFIRLVKGGCPSFNL